MWTHTTSYYHEGQYESKDLYFFSDTSITFEVILTVHRR